MANKIGIVAARFNFDITGKLVEGATARLKERGIVLQARDTVWVPGAVEVPLLVQQLALSGDYDAVIAFAAVIKGETDHYDYVCQQVSAGCQQVSLQHNLPVIFGVLTTPNRQLALARVGGDRGHHGVDSVDATLDMLELMGRYAVRGKDSVCYER